MRPAEIEPRRGSLEHACAQGTWMAAGRREPLLAELLEDPIMRLLWARDRLEPERARAIVRALQAMLHGHATGLVVRAA